MVIVVNMAFKDRMTACKIWLGSSDLKSQNLGEGSNSCAPAQVKAKLLAEKNYFRN